jgi:hypothetical protein
MLVDRPMSNRSQFKHHVSESRTSVFWVLGNTFRCEPQATQLHQAVRFPMCTEGQRQKSSGAIKLSNTFSTSGSRAHRQGRRSRQLGRARMCRAALRGKSGRLSAQKRAVLPSRARPNQTVLKRRSSQPPSPQAVATPDWYQNQCCSMRLMRAAEPPRRQTSRRV